MPFTVPVIPYDGEFLSALFHMNPLLANTTWLAAQAARGWSSFTGSIWGYNEQYEHTEHRHYGGVFRYTGRNNLVGKIVNTAGRMRVYCQYDDGSGGFLEATLFNGYTNPVFPMDISGGGAYAHTVGQYYEFYVSGDPEWVVGASLDAGHVDHVAIEVANGINGDVYPTVPTFVDGNVLTKAQLELVYLAQRFHRQRLTPLCGSQKLTGVEFIGPAQRDWYNGGFYVRNGPVANQRSLRVISRFQNGPSSVLVYDSAGVLQRSEKSR